MNKILKLTAILSLLGLGTSAQATPILYAITGDGGSPQETLFTIDTSTAIATSFLTLGAGDDGETIGFNPNDGLLYHSSGISNGQRAWESINVGVPGVVTSTQFTGSNVDDENLAMTWNPATGTFLVTDRDDELFSATTAGVATDIGSTPENLKGLAFAQGSLWGGAVFDNLLYELNPLNGSEISNVVLSMTGFNVNGLTGLATNPDTGDLFALVKARGGRRLATLDPLTGILSDIGLITGGDGWAGIAFGEATAKVPEPATLALFGIGLAGLGFARKNKHKQKKKSV